MEDSAVRAMVRVVMNYPEPKEWEFPAGTLVQVILGRLGINPESVLVISSGRLLTPDQPAEGTAAIEIVPVISGGSPL